jgi:hypothetical protein
MLAAGGFQVQFAHLGPEWLGRVDVHLVLMTVAARWIMAAKL